MERIVVITPTSGRLPVLRRCLRSVAAQDYAGMVRHLLLGDHLQPQVAAAVESSCREFGATFLNDTRPVDTFYQPSRIGRLRNLGVDQSDMPFVAHLDDDNTFDPEHLRTLAERLVSNPSVDIAHSWRRILTEDGRPVRLRRYPWVIAHRRPVAREVFEALAREGIFEDGSPVIRDRIPDAHNDLFHIDSSEWMMRRRVFDVVRFREAATPREMIYQYTDDYLFCRDCARAGLTFGCTERVTLNYYLGGYSVGRDLED